MWFTALTGFEEISAENVREHIEIDGKNLFSKANGKSFQFGVLEIPTLSELKEKAPSAESFKHQIKVSEIVADVQQLHLIPQNKHALFQAASQFNLLEMTSPGITPEHGIDIYDRDFTQGPACAIACGAGTIYRNYFVPLDGQKGQTHDRQIDCLALIGEAFNNQEFHHWTMRNGYALLTKDGLTNIHSILHKLSDTEREQIKGKLQIGIQWDTEVTLADQQQMVSQAYCSALPVAYSPVKSPYWESFARVILEATYEATLYAGLINGEKTGCYQVYLTLVGGGVFGNEIQWILESMTTALRKFQRTPLEIKIVSHRDSNPLIQKMIREIA